MQIKELYRIAGILDGEGCFLWRKTKKKKGGKEYYSNYAEIRCGMTDEDIMVYLGNFLGCSVCGPYQKDQTSKPMYYISVTGTRAISWMMLLYPLMFTRRKEKIKEIINLWKSELPKPKYRKYCKRGHEYISENKYTYVDKTGKEKNNCKLCQKVRYLKRKYENG